MTSDQGSGDPRLEPRFDQGGGAPLGVDPYDRPAHDPRRTTRKRILAAIVALVAFGGFAGIAWYATSTGKNDPTAMVPVITAENTPVKERPAEPGGLEVPNRDMEVFNRITPSSEPQKVEQLLPPAENPIARPEPDPEPPSGPKVPDAPAIAERSTSGGTARTVGTSPVAPAIPPGGTASDIAPAAPEAPPAPESEPAPPPASQAAPEPEPVPEQTAKAVTGDWRVQLGASRDEKRARAALERIVKANTDLLGGLPTDIRRADLGAKGVFYRMRIGSFADRAGADFLCNKLKDRKVTCAIVKR